MHSTLIILLMLVAVFARASAQVDVQFSTFATDATGSDLFYISDGIETPIPVPALARSSLQRYHGDRFLKFYRYVDAGNAGEVKRQEVGSVLLPEEGGSVLLLWIVEKPDQYIIRALPEGVDRFPLGRARIYNASPYPIAIKGPETTLKLLPGKIGYMNGDGRRFPISLASKIDDEWTVLGHNVFALNEATRCTVVVALSANESLEWKQGGDPQVGTTPKLHILGIEDRPYQTATSTPLNPISH